MIIELGISGEDKYFWRTSETMQILALALPHLSGQTRINAQIAGVLAYARIMKKAGKEAEADRAMARLAELVSFRVHHELADSNFVRPTKTATYRLHQAKIPRYASLTPELAQMLHDFAGDKFRANIAALSADLPIWHHAFGERLIGGENYISPPTLARGLFAAMADGQNASPAELFSRLDQPWCRADLYYIEKLSAVLRRIRR